MDKYVELLFQNNMLELGIVFLIIILSMNYLDIKIILILICILLFYSNSDDIFTSIKKNESKKQNQIIENNIRNKKNIKLHHNINDIINKLYQYRKYNPNSYDNGLKYINIYTLLIQDLEKDNISHPRQYFENAQFNLQQSVNNFQSLSFSIPEEKYNDILKYNKKEPTKLANRIGTLCSELNKQGEYLLFNLSIKLNEKWSEDINIYKTLIHINSENIKESNIYENNYDLY